MNIKFFRKAILLIHGFAGGNYDYGSLGNDLQLYNNFDVFTFTLPGHDKVIIDKVTRKDWIDKAEYEIEKIISNGYREIYIIGHSMGGVIASHLASKYKEVAKLVLAAPAFKYFTFDKDDFDTKTALLNSPKVFKEYGKEKVLSRLVQFPKSVLKEFMDLVSESQLLPSLIDVPTLIVQGSADIVVPLKSSEALYDEIKSKKKKIIVLDNVSHDIFRSSEVDSLCIKIKDFLNDKD